MQLNLRILTLCFSAFQFQLYSATVYALEFEPGVGVGFEFTDNATLVAEDKVDEIISVGYVGGRISDNDGPLSYDVIASLNNSTYTKDTFPKQQDINLVLQAEWAMVKDRVNWTVSDNFSQQTVNAINSNTPNNLQDTNTFSLAVDLLFPLSVRHSFSLTPMFSQNYYEKLLTDNKQLSLAANWNYKMFRLTNIGLNVSTRNINYNERRLVDTTFTILALVFDGVRARSTFSSTIGATNVERDSGEGETGFSGDVTWMYDLSSRSSISATLFSDITDAGTAAAVTPGDNPSIGNDVQVTADVVRNSALNMSYQREDASLQSSLLGAYNKVKYSNNPLDQVSKSLELRFDYPVTRYLSSGVYVNYDYIKRLATARVDESHTVGANLNYNFSRKLRGLIDFKFREKKSNFDSENYEDVSVYVGLVYGFGDVRRPSRSGGF